MLLPDINQNSHQIRTWKSEFGSQYTDRNIYTPQELDKVYIEYYGISRSQLNENFLKDLNIYNERILEVGSNVGNQLRLLQKQGFNNLYGIDVSSYAVEKSKKMTKNINIISGIGSNIPYKDNFFEMVFTSSVLIHINPSEIELVMGEIYRCSRKYIYGFEYYSEKYQEIEYRGNKKLLWKANFAKIYLDKFPRLKLIKEEKIKYLHENNENSIFLLEKML